MKPSFILLVFAASSASVLGHTVYDDTDDDIAMIRAFYYRHSDADEVSQRLIIINELMIVRRCLILVLALICNA